MSAFSERFFDGYWVGVLCAIGAVMLMALIFSGGHRDGCRDAVDLLRHSGQEAQVKFVMENCR